MTDERRAVPMMTPTSELERWLPEAQRRANQEAFEAAIEANPALVEALADVKPKV